MSIRLKCPNLQCGELVWARERVVGRHVRCPKCGRSIDVPDVGVPAALLCLRIDADDGGPIVKEPGGPTPYASRATQMPTVELDLFESGGGLQRVDRVVRRFKWAAQALGALIVLTGSLIAAVGVLCVVAPALVDSHSDRQAVRVAGTILLLQGIAAIGFGVFSIKKRFWAVQVIWWYCAATMIFNALFGELDNFSKVIFNLLSLAVLTVGGLALHFANEVKRRGYAASILQK
jgi:hypothetical protein